MHLRALGLTLALTLVSLATTSCSSSSSDESAAPQTSFPAPVRKGGETWTTRSTYTVTPPDEAPPATETTIYVDIVGERGAYTGRGVGNDNVAVPLTYNVEGQLVTAGTCSFSPAVNQVVFPLEVGRKWDIDYTSCSKTRTTGNGQVVGRETLTTAAFGAVDVLKLVMTTTSVFPGDPARETPESRSSATLTSYWAPKFGLSVKEVYEVPAENGGGPRTMLTELVKYSRPQ